MSGLERAELETIKLTQLLTFPRKESAQEISSYFFFLFVLSLLFLLTFETYVPSPQW